MLSVANARKSSARQSGDDHVVTARVQFVSEPHELLGTGRNAVKEHDGDRPHLPVEQQFGAALVRNAAMVAAAEALEQRAGLVG